MNTLLSTHIAIQLVNSEHLQLTNIMERTLRRIDKCLYQRLLSITSSMDIPRVFDYHAVLMISSKKMDLDEEIELMDEVLVASCQHGDDTK